jgi:hypothetical protein
MTLLAFHNDNAVRQKYLDRVRAHKDADEIIKGAYWENGRGCAVGCTIHGSEHARYETELGIPQALARLEDRIFEGLTNGLAKEWPLRFLQAVPLGKDLSLVSWKFLHWLQKENLKEAKKNKMPANVIAAIKQCVDVLADKSKAAASKAAASAAAASAELAARSVESLAASEAAWSATAAARSAELAAWAATASATWAAWSSAASVESLAASAASAAWSATASAAAASVESPASAAWSAAATWSALSVESAARSVESAARWAAAWGKMADKLIELLEAV